MNDNRATGHVESTPEAEPLDLRSTGRVDSGPAESGAKAAEALGGAAKDRAGATGHDVAERLKPVAAVAADMAVKGVDLAAKGLTRLSAMLEERRRARGSGGPEDQQS
jgi:hypothetical protein